MTDTERIAFLEACVRTGQTVDIKMNGFSVDVYYSTAAGYAENLGDAIDCLKTNMEERMIRRVAKKLLS